MIQRPKKLKPLFGIRRQIRKKVVRHNAYNESQVSIQEQVPYREAVRMLREYEREASIVQVTDEAYQARIKRAISEGNVHAVRNDNNMITHINQKGLYYMLNQINR